MSLLYSIHIRVLSDIRDCLVSQNGMTGSQSFVIFGPHRNGEDHHQWTLERTTDIEYLNIEYTQISI
jgi:hypothetical protein